MKRKKLGLGTIALLLFVLTFAWGTIWDNGLQETGLGIFVLKSIGLSYLLLQIPNFVYYFIFLFTIPAIIIGRKHEEDWGAKTGWVLSTVLSIILFVLLLISFINILK